MVWPNTNCPAHLLTYLPDGLASLSQTFIKCLLSIKHCAGDVVESETSMVHAVLEVTVYWEETHT